MNLDELRKWAQDNGYVDPPRPPRRQDETWVILAEADESNCVVWNNLFPRGEN